MWKSVESYYREAKEKKLKGHGAGGGKKGNQQYKQQKPVGAGGGWRL